jgi:hypothetical protein
MSATDVCPACGRNVSGLDREVTFGFPDEVFALSDEERVTRVTGFGKSFITLGSDRFFLRVLLPVQLDIGREFRFGVWIELSMHEYKRIWDLWDEPEYSAVSVEGVLANAVPPWADAIGGAPCKAATRNATDTLYIESSTQPALATVLTSPWATHECEELISSVWGGPPPDAR